MDPKLYAERRLEQYANDPEAAKYRLPEPSTVSEAQLAANRENAQHSTGPRTEAGKRRSCLNAYRHGLTGQIVCQTEEDLAAFKKHCADVTAEHKPIGPTETFLANSIAENMWRINRIRAIENGIFAAGFRELVDSIGSGHPEADAGLASAETFKQQAKEIALLTVYEGRISRTLTKNMRELKELQSIRKQTLEDDLDRAAILMEQAEAANQPYDPAEDGFVFSTAEITAHRNRKIRFEVAWKNHIARKNGRPAPKSDQNSDLKAA